MAHITFGPVRVEGGLHSIAWTLPDEVNRALLAFLAA